MSNKFMAFMKPKDSIKTKEIIISDRFTDEEGKVIPFVIRSITPGEEKRIREACITTEGTKRDFDANKYEDELIKISVITPDLKNIELQDFYGVTGEIELLNEMLTVGDYRVLTDAINKFNGLDRTYEDKVKEVKN